MNIPKILKRTREVIKTDAGKNIQTSYYINRKDNIPGRGVSKEKDITYRTKDKPRIKYIDKQVVKRDKEGHLKSLKETKNLLDGFKKIKSDVTYKTYQKKGGIVKSKK